MSDPLLKLFRFRKVGIELADNSIAVGLLGGNFLERGKAGGGLGTPVLRMSANRLPSTAHCFFSLGNFPLKCKARPELLDYQVKDTKPRSVKFTRMREIISEFGVFCNAPIHPIPTFLA
jgi:hypothetical protein